MERVSRMGRLLLFIMVLVTACVFQQAVSEAGKDIAEVKESLKPSGIHEDCMVLTEGQGMEYSFSSSVPLSFNIHYHEGADIFYSVQKDNTSHEAGRFEAPKEQHYCLMWTNPSKEFATITYRVKVEKK